jgi:2-polyprenyl-3-methyl-5-hydroxy-6-metoxy-1,4-benzoquinol methylase
MIKSPITGKEASILETYNTADIKTIWQKTLGIDISKEFSDTPKLYKCLCRESLYEFYYPHSLEGSSNLYDQLSKTSWYYASEKWEHILAVEELSKRASDNKELLEIGSGRGDFLMLCKQNFNAQGIELNKAAAKLAKKNGLNVSTADLSEFAPLHYQHFGSVVIFQVLEHIAHPLPFLKQCIHILEPGGNLIVTVPNGHGLFAQSSVLEHILDAPPHHMGKWNISAMQYLTTLLPLSVESMIYEPLQRHHLKGYIKRFLATPSGKTTIDKKLLAKLLAKLLLFYAKKYNVYPKWQGHTLFVHFKTRD